MTRDLVIAIVCTLLGLVVGAASARPRASEATTIAPEPIAPAADPVVAVPWADCLAFCEGVMGRAGCFKGPTEHAL